MPRSVPVRRLGGRLPRSGLVRAGHAGRRRGDRRTAPRGRNPRREAALPADAGLTGGIVYEARRKRFMDAMGKGVAIFPSAPVRTRSNDTDYEYRQNSDFFYLTGFNEPESVAVL